MRRSPADSSGLSSVARSIVPPDTAPAPTIECISSTKRIGFGRALERRDDGLEPFLEVAAEPVPARSAPVSSAYTSASFNTPWTSSCRSREASPSAIAVLPTPDSPTNTGLFLRRRHSTSMVRWSSSVRPMSGSSSPWRARSVRLTQNAFSASAGAGAPPGPSSVEPCAGTARSKAAGPHLRDTVRDVVQDVQPGDALSGQQLRRVALGLLEDRREHVAGVRLVAPGALDVHDSRLQHAAKRHGLLRLALAAAFVALDRLVEVRRQGLAQGRQIGAAGRENPFAVGVVQQRVQQVLEREVRMLARDGLAQRHGEHDFKRV